LSGAEAGTVEPGGELKQRVIAAGAYGVQEFARALLDLRIEQAGSAGEAFERLGEPRLRMAEHVHGVMLAEETAKVKSRRAAEPPLEAAPEPKAVRPAAPLRRQFAQTFDLQNGRLW
jgi:hypothetical protein